MGSKTTQMQIMNMPSLGRSVTKAKMQQGIIRNARTRIVIMTFIKRLMRCLEISQTNGSLAFEIWSLPEIKCYLSLAKGYKHSGLNPYSKFIFKGIIPSKAY
jgi:hypothetical protein